MNALIIISCIIGFICTAGCIRCMLLAAGYMPKYIIVASSLENGGRSICKYRDVFKFFSDTGVWSDDIRAARVFTSKRKAKRATHMLQHFAPKFRVVVMKLPKTYEF